MAWYAAHIIQYARFLNGEQDTYPCHENIVLIEAESEVRALEEAESIGQAHYGTNYGSSFTWEGRPAEWVFAGIRKLIECDNLDPNLPDSKDQGFRPTHGTEITYSRLLVADQDDLGKLIHGDTVGVVYDE